MRRSIVLATTDYLSMVPLVQRADRSGFSRIWTTETPTRDALVRALVLGLQTERIGWASGIAYAFTRLPLAMAATASDVDTALGGRFSLGLGAGTRGMRRTWFGIEDYEHPATRMAEYAALLRAAWAAESAVQFDGTFYRARFDQFHGRRRAIPIWGSGLNPAMLTVAGRHFDGVALHPLTSQLSYLSDVALAAIGRGAEKRDVAVQIAVWKITSIDDDADVARLRAKRSLAMYFSTPSYATVADHSGWGAIAEQVRAVFRERGPSWTDIAALIPEEMVDDFCLAGTPVTVAARWAALEKRYREVGIDEVVFQTPLDDNPAYAAGRGGSGQDSLAAIIGALAPESAVPDQECAR